MVIVNLDTDGELVIPVAWNCIPEGQFILEGFPVIMHGCYEVCFITDKQTEF